MDPYHIKQPRNGVVPVVISIPHSGVHFPDEIRDHYRTELISAPEDTDWFVDQLYSFATDLGITIIHATYSRWVIDLNRDPSSAPLYNDGRIVTDLCPTSTFAGEPIYLDGCMPKRSDIKDRLEKIYWPYYDAIQQLLDERKKEFGHVLLWDAHSIKQYVPLIRKEVFPDLILGDNHEKAASPVLINKAVSTLENTHLHFQHNKPFKGGHITRYFGKPEENQHALQLEMTKINYMDNHEVDFDQERAAVIQKILRNTFEGLIGVLNEGI